VNDEFPLERTDSLVCEDHSGERMVPEISGGSTFWEHVYRYAFACRFVKGKRVLDVACGEGYGLAALQKAGAARVIGLDISEPVCQHARTKYGLDVRVATAEQIPLADASMDVIVSFETIEHIPNPGLFLDECGRVLVPGGRLVISTPNKDVYSGWGQPTNPHHCSEMTEEEFASALRTRFHKIKLYSQRARWAAWWSLRTLAADETPWNRLGLFRRLHRSAQFRLAPISVYDPSSEQRNAVMAQILSSARVRRSILNPYVLRPRREWTREQPTYFIATAIS
jgi:2-polyprenyl-3-methyl-5-hydroxy-6-metoxy-1,4-benzoquinol methylase